MYYDVLFDQESGFTYTPTCNIHFVADASCLSPIMSYGCPMSGGPPDMVQLNAVMCALARAL